MDSINIHIIIRLIIKWCVSFRIYLIITLFSILFQINIIGQQEEFNLNKIIVVRPESDSIIDVIETIIPGSIYWTSGNDTLHIPYQITDNRIRPLWQPADSTYDSVFIHFMTLPYPFHGAFNLQDSSQIRVVEGDIYYNPIRPSGQRDLFESSGLEYDGFMTRGFFAWK